MIELTNISKTFPLHKSRSKSALKEIEDPREEKGTFRALSDISLTCNKGEVLGLIGPNGAGKTTTLRILSTAILPTSGTAKVDGIDIISNPLEARKRIGFLSGSTGLYGRLTARENIEYFGRLHQVSPEKLNARMNDIFSLLNMHSFADIRADDLSTGMKQKTSIARTVIHEPKVIIFDEPTTGLDVMSAKTILVLAPFQTPQSLAPPFRLLIRH